jgi:hypothetical protein
MDAERIIKNDDMIIKKLFSENNIKILVEFLEKEENLTENEIQLYIFNRNSHRKIYENKKNYILNIENNKITSEEFYNSLRKFCHNDNITIAKYAKYFYEWEIIPEMGSEGVYNLLKSNFKIKDGDWISIRNDDIENSEKDDFSTEEDKKVLFFFLYFLLIYLDFEFDKIK